MQTGFFSWVTVGLLGLIRKGVVDKMRLSDRQTVRWSDSLTQIILYQETAIIAIQWTIIIMFWLTLLGFP
jgi:hypothetical protein